MEFGNSRVFQTLVRQRRAHSLNQLREIMDLSWLEHKDYKIVNTPELLDWAISHIDKARIISLDTETTGLNIYNLAPDNPIKDKIVGMSISWERNQGIYIPFEHTCFQNLDKRYVFQRLHKYLETKSIVTHNGLFDGKVFYDEGIRLHITQDTMLIEFNLDSTVSKGSKGLKAITRRRYGYDVIELEDIFESAKDAGLFMYVEEELVRAYACADSDHTLMAFMDSFQDLLPGQIRSYTLDIRVQSELIRSEYYGKGVDMDLLHQLHKVYTNDSQRIEELIYRYVGESLVRKHGMSAHGNQYRFNIGSSQDLSHVLFDLLGYPIPEELKGSKRISVDKNTLKALLKIDATSPDEVFDALVPEDIQSDIANAGFDWVSDKDRVLVSRDELASKEYKVVQLIQKYRKIEKLRSSFFAPLLFNNYEGKYFSGIFMTRAETARIIDFIQTLDKSLKKLIRPYDAEKQYLVDFDFAQIEYRVMAGQSGMTELSQKLNHPEADYHREGGSLILAKPPEDITNSERSSLKSVNFGIPYGMSEYGILNNRYGIGLSKEEREEKLEEIREMLAKWNANMGPIRDMLNAYRTAAVTPVEDSTLPSHLRGRSVGRIANALGRTRLFYLDKLSKQKIASIKRQAGNYPIQSFAREIFCEAFCDFCDACKKYGLMDVRVPDETRASGYRFENKIVIMAYIHDECLMAVDKDVNHEFVYKLIYENCMKEIPGHPRYYCGINVITNWYEGKDDKFEAPVGYVQEVIAKNPPVFRDPVGYNPRDEALAGITDWVIRRIARELESLDPNTRKGYFDLPTLVPRFKNYFVKPKIASYIGLHASPINKSDPDEFSRISIESYALYAFKKSIIRGLDGKVYELVRESDVYTPKIPTSMFLVDKDSERYLELEADSFFDVQEDDDTEPIIDIEITDEAISSFEKAYTTGITSLDWSFKKD